MTLTNGNIKLQTRSLCLSLRPALAAALLPLLLLLQEPVIADVARIEIHERELLDTQDTAVQYEAITGLLHFTLDPQAAGNQKIVDLALAPTNAQGLVEYSTDFRLLVPRDGPLGDTLLYQVNNRGRSSLPPDQSLQHPLSTRGYTFLSTGWIAELEAGEERLRLHAPVIGDANSPVTGQVRYEVYVNAPASEASIAGAAHLAYRPTAAGLRDATLTRRLNQAGPREPVPREDFSLRVEEVPDSEQVRITLSVAGGLVPGMLYELIYEAQDPVLAGTGSRSAATGPGSARASTRCGRRATSRERDARGSDRAAHQLADHALEVPQAAAGLHPVAGRREPRHLRVPNGPERARFGVQPDHPARALADLAPGA